MHRHSCKLHTIVYLIQRCPHVTIVIKSIDNNKKNAIGPVCYRRTNVLCTNRTATCGITLVTNYRFKSANSELTVASSCSSLFT